MPIQRRDLWTLAAAVLVLVLLWRLSAVLLLVFGAVLLCLVLRRLAEPLHQRLRLPEKAALALVVGVALAGIAAITAVAGAAAAEQLGALAQTLPRAFGAFEQWLASVPPLGPWLLQMLRDASLAPADWLRLAGIAGGTVNLAAAALLLLALGIYLAADAESYRSGFLRLVPPPRRALAAGTLDALGHDLTRWLLGQAVSMAAVGAMTAVGLALLGVPLAWTLGVIAGLFDFVPYAGPIASGALIVLVALTEGDRAALAALVLVVAVQQAEAYVVVPLVQRWAVRLAPVLGMLAVVVFGLLFGLPGVLLAVPLMVCCVALVRHLYVARLERPPDAQYSVPR